MNVLKLGVVGVGWDSVSCGLESVGIDLGALVLFFIWFFYGLFIQWFGGIRL